MKVNFLKSRQKKRFMASQIMCWGNVRKQNLSFNKEEILLKNKEVKHSLLHIGTFEFFSLRANMPINTAGCTESESQVSGTIV